MYTSCIKLAKCSVCIVRYTLNLPFLTVLCLVSSLDPNVLSSPRFLEQLRTPFAESKVRRLRLSLDKSFTLHRLLFCTESSGEFDFNSFGDFGDSGGLGCLHWLKPLSCRSSSALRLSSWLTFAILCRTKSHKLEACIINRIVSSPNGQRVIQ